MVHLGLCMHAVRQSSVCCWFAQGCCAARWKGQVPRVDDCAPPTLPSIPACKMHNPCVCGYHCSGSELINLAWCARCLENIYTIPHKVQEVVWCINTSARTITIPRVTHLAAASCVCSLCSAAAQYALLYWSIGQSRPLSGCLINYNWLFQCTAGLLCIGHV